MGQGSYKGHDPSVLPSVIPAGRDRALEVTSSGELDAQFLINCGIKLLSNQGES